MVDLLYPKLSDGCNKFNLFWYNRYKEFKIAIKEVLVFCIIFELTCGFNNYIS